MKLAAEASKQFSSALFPMTYLRSAKGNLIKMNQITQRDIPRMRSSPSIVSVSSCDSGCGICE